MKLRFALPFLALLSLMACRSGDYLLQEDAPPSATMGVQFEVPQEQDLPVGSAQLMRMDWNQDGTPELVIPVPQRSVGSDTEDDGRIQVFSIQPQSTDWLQWIDTWQPSSPHWHQSFAMADLDQDGNQDLVLTRSESVYLSLIKGPERQDDNLTRIVGLTPIALQVGDWNQDNRTDLAVANRGSDSISVLLNQGDDNFTTSVTLATGDFPQQLQQGDWNNDGLSDLAVISVGGNLLELWEGNGDGTFQVAGEWETPNTPQQLQLGDWDCDGNLDLAVSSRSDKLLRLWYGAGDGTFAGPVDLAAGRGPASFATADFNEDGILDFVVSNRFVVSLTSTTTLSGDLALVLSQGTRNHDSSDYADPELFAATQRSLGDAPGDILVEDLDQDGRLDLLVALPLQEKIAMFRGKQYRGRLSCL